MTNIHNILRFQKDEPFLLNSIDQFMAVSFVVSAVATGGYKPALNCIMATETNLYGTNGYVLHVAENLPCLPPRTLLPRSENEGANVDRKI